MHERVGVLAAAVVHDSRARGDMTAYVLLAVFNRPFEGKLDFGDDYHVERGAILGYEAPEGECESVYRARERLAAGRRRSDAPGAEVCNDL